MSMAGKNVPNIGQIVQIWTFFSLKLIILQEKRESQFYTLKTGALNV